MRAQLEHDLCPGSSENLLDLVEGTRVLAVRIEPVADGPRAALEEELRARIPLLFDEALISGPLGDDDDA